MIKIPTNHDNHLRSSGRARKRKIARFYRQTAGTGLSLWAIFPNFVQKLGIQSIRAHHSSLFGLSDIFWDLELKNIRSKIWIRKNQGAKKQGHFYSKREEAAWPFLFLNNNHPFFRFIFWTWFFSGSQTDPLFQNKNSGCRLTEQLSFL